MENRRHFTRIESDLDVVITLEDNHYQGKLIDLSLKGILLEIKDLNCPIDSLCNIIVPLGEGGIKMEFASKLVHQENHHFGFEFVGEDLESMIHLRRFLELNSDPDKIIKELFFLIK
jgi:hypothetical protein